jgi:hypothetical protein
VERRVTDVAGQHEIGFVAFEPGVEIGVTEVKGHGPGHGQVVGGIVVDPDPEQRSLLTSSAPDRSTHGALFFPWWFRSLRSWLPEHTSAVVWSAIFRM